MSSNPLTAYSRPFKINVSLPSNGKYYSNDVLTLNSNNEVSIRAMSTKDEIALKNPDGLFSGESIEEVIKSCCPTVTNVRKLLTNDLEVIMLGIKIASGLETIDITEDCPECGHKNEFTVPSEVLIAQIDELEDEYTVNLDDDLLVYLKPYTFESFTKLTLMTFKQNKIMQSIDPEDTSEETLNNRRKLFKDIVTLTENIMSESIVKIKVLKENTVVTDRQHIFEFVQNLQESMAKKINTKITEINNIGISKTLDAVCMSDECNHSWTVESFDINPADFFA